MYKKNLNQICNGLIQIMNLLLFLVVFGNFRFSKLFSLLGWWWCDFGCHLLKSAASWRIPSAKCFSIAFSWCFIIVNDVILMFCYHEIIVVVLMLIFFFCIFKILHEDRMRADIGFCSISTLNIVYIVGVEEDWIESKRC